jgi:hypothetical protein
MEMDSEEQTPTAYLIPIVELEVVTCHAPGCRKAATATVIVSPSGAAIGHFCDRHVKAVVTIAKEVAFRADDMAAHAE